MRLVASAAGLLLLAPSLSAESAAPAPPPGYTLVWSDEFKNDPDGLPDPKKWIYEDGFVRNNESQFYTARRLENARVEHGQLIIEGRKEDYPYSVASGPGIAHYTSAALETYTKADWLYGRIEVRAKLPAGRGVWPAIWMLGSNISQRGIGWPKCGEIDIMELVGKEPGVIYGTLHWADANSKLASYGQHVTLDHPENDFHVYAADWTADALDLSIDGHVYNHFVVEKATAAGRNPFRERQFLLLNLALGGDWGGPIDDSIFPQRMVVDYVRVYQKASATP
jgi:beta-glucanase (GH16 family)